MAMPVDRRQLELIASKEAPVVARAKPVTSAKVVEVPALEVRVWGKDEEATARARLGEMVQRVGHEGAAGLLGIDVEHVRSLRVGLKFGPELGERMVVLEMPEGDALFTRERRRSARKRAVRARTESVKRMTKAELERGRLESPEDALTRRLRAERPRTRGECKDGPRPCAWASCKWHLAISVNEDTGALKYNFPDLDIWDMPETCALDLSDRGGLTFEQVADATNVVRERIRQVSEVALAKLEAAGEMYALRDFVDEPPPGRRHLPVLRVVRDEPDTDEPDADWLSEEG